VTILERSNGVQVENHWTPAPPRSRPKRKAKAAERAPSEEGKIETFTMLYVTPDGFLPPLALALIRDRSGQLVMAQGEDVSHLKIGREVYLRQLGGGYVFTVKSQLRTVREALKKLLRRVPSPADRNESKRGRKESP
jgi:hypothetical protein